MKIVFTETATFTNGELSLAPFEALGDVTYYPLTKGSEVAERTLDADVIICNKAPMTEATLKNAKNLKYIGVLATGYNNVDMDYINIRNIVVSNAGNYSTEAVSQHVFALLLNEYSKAAAYNDYVQSGAWKETPIFSPFVFPTKELAGKTMGIIGYGNIGQAVAKIAVAFGMKVLVYNRSKKQDSAVVFCDMDTLLRDSDVVSVHCPLNEASQEMFNEETFGKMKDHAYFINTSRGGIVVESAMAQALKSGKLRGAAIDVITKEPMSEECLLCHVPNLTITPHIAWTPLETRQRLLDITLANLKGFLAGAPQNVVSQKQHQ